MTDKYTIRDFLVYFLTGLFLLVTLMYNFGNSLLDYFRITQTDIKEHSALTIFLLIPGLYILGHIIHSIDYLVYKFGRYVWDFKKKYSVKLNRFKILCLFNVAIIAINGNRVTGVLDGKSQCISNFWERTNELQCKGMYHMTEYWYLMNDLFKGLSLTSLGWAIFYCYIHNIINLIVSLILTFLFWSRARFMATKFVSTVNNSWNIISRRS